MHAEARMEITPSITVSGEYNDNVNETRRDTEDDFILILTPGVALTYEARRLDLDLAYTLSYYDYLNDTRGSETAHRLSAFSEIRLTENMVRLELRDTYSQVYRDRTRGEVLEGETLRDQIDQNIFVASPYLNLRPADRTTLRTGYRYTDIWYRGDDGTDSQAHTLFADLGYELTARTGLTAAYSYTDLESDDGDERGRVQAARDLGRVPPRVRPGLLPLRQRRADLHRPQTGEEHHGPDLAGRRDPRFRPHGRHLRDRAGVSRGPGPRRAREDHDLQRQPAPDLGPRHDRAHGHLRDLR
jgi:hypothetical protein